MFLEENPEKWIQLEEVESTNTAILTGNYPAGSVMLAKTQSAGRGRHGRVWNAISGRSFIFSGLVEMPDFDERRALFLPLVFGLAVYHASVSIWKILESSKNLPDIRIKWPNDVCILENGKPGKLAGILVESVFKPGRVLAAVGIGLNWSAAPLVEGNFPAVCLFPDRLESPGVFALPLVQEINRLLVQLYSGDLEKLISEISAVSLLKNYPVIWNQKSVLALGLAPDGGLIIEDNGERRLVYDTVEL